MGDQKRPPRPQKCRNCNGRGTVLLPGPSKNAGAWLTTCRDCGGTGQR